ncbi:MAG: MarR family winged helix-turn-helix transcriptional regulator [Bulleidia sp.]
MKKTDERVLDAWVAMTMAVDAERRISGMTFSEAVICHFLSAAEDHQLTASQLCEKTHMQKSQMNRTLNAMEEKKLIIRKRSETDHRKILITFNPENALSFSSMHTDILSFVNGILSQLDETEIEEAIHIFTRVAEIAGKETK